jgi:hypothetical protein
MNSRSRDKIIVFLCLVFAASLLMIGEGRLDYINSVRKEMKLVSNEPLENAPPSLAFASVAMGAFRGLLVDVLWMRADNLKMEGQFFDAKQLAEWITILQPRFAEVWDFQAWNMAYNISVAMPAGQPAERWRWVKNGIELLRDEGIPKNPKNIQLYQRLAWIFFHKMGGVSDDCHKYYRLQLAMSMQPLLEPLTNETFEKIAAAPSTWEQVIAKPGMASFVTAMQKADPNFEPGDKFVKAYLSLKQIPDRYAPAAFRTLEKFRATPAIDTFDWFARSWELRNTWKMDPAMMLALNRRYGPKNWDDPNKREPLNWEHPVVHAMYWGALGLKTAGDGNDFRVDEINTDRVVFHSLQELFRTGRQVIYDSPVEVDANELKPGEQAPPMVAKSVFMFPDLRMFDSYNEAMMAVIDKYKKLGSDVVSVENGHRNMLTNAVVTFYQCGHQAYATKIYNELRRLYPRKDFDKPVPEYVRGYLKDELRSITINKAVEIIIGMLEESYLHYGLREDDEATSRETMAREVWERYTGEWKDEKVKRVDLPQFSMLRYLALDSFLRDEMYPANLRQNLMDRIHLERPQIYAELLRSHSELQRRIQAQEANSVSETQK